MSQPNIVTESGEGTLEVFSLPTDTAFLQTLISDVFENYWDQIYFWHRRPGCRVGSPRTQYTPTY